MQPPPSTPFPLHLNNKGLEKAPCLFYFQMFSVLKLPLKKKHESEQVVATLLDNNDSETTLSGVASGKMGRGAVQTACRGNHLTLFHLISTAECVHFQANGMSFCQSLWSRINPGIKTDFLGSNLPSTIDFFTLTTSVLPNLT